MLRTPLVWIADALLAVAMEGFTRWAVTAYAANHSFGPLHAITLSLIVLLGCLGLYAVTGFWTPAFLALGALAGTVHAWWIVRRKSTRD